MSDEKDQDQSPEETPEAADGASEDLDPQALADEVAGGVEDANSEDQALADEWAAAMEESGDSENDDIDDLVNDAVQQVQLDELKDEGGPVQSDGNPELDVILDIPVRISMEVGATKIPIRNLLQLNQGSVVELDRLAGEPLDVLVNGTLIAHGEVVMVNDKFGIRLTDVVSQSERIHRLR